MRIGSVEFEKKGRIAYITLDEPSKLNALSAGIREGVTESLAKIEADDEIRVGIITGRGDKAFCAGADISGFPETPEQTRQFIATILPFLQSPERCRKPLIAAVNGMAFGGGFELAIACDFILASERAKFGVPEIQLGLLPGFAVVRLHEIVGRPKAKELSMLGEPIDAAEAVRLGIALRTVPHEKLLEEATAFAEKLAAKPRMAVEMAKSFYNRGLGGDEMRYAADAFPFLFLTEDVKEGVSAFREKRKPQFG
ncbi:enoyl-CoA hydratase/isomerase family protein [Extensimonas vulgaris]|uniref:Enoyl-CoA hydratase n=1 Tax=Extensimonas vulgaris TaxID=1031594 RepID=A0A369AGS7_9BURK|nr:enoyl-CoA hydratase/isomerase family protein [Extensimonas vulgaris]RCX08560.1 enoyl-CoA hydratase [Extensimonas vulgaris]TWI39850.1 enoyl-CoA hydratase [Extensimonas vulgaris]